MVYLTVILSLLLTIVVYILFMILFYKNKMEIEGMSSYECGFDPYSSTRLTFSYRFYLISVLFIIFDVEISLMLSIPFSVDLVGMWVFVYFIIILIVGLLYEYYCGSLNWLSSFIIKS